MGNEASLEGGEGGSVLGVAGAPGPVSASPSTGQHIKPLNGAAAGGGAVMGSGAAMNRLAGAPTSPKTGYGSSGGTGVGGGLGMGGIGGMPGRGDSYRLATHESPRPSPIPQSQNLSTSHGMGTDQGPGQHASRRNLQVDFSSGGSAGRTGRSPSVSPDRGSAPSSPYSVPQIAPMPSSKLCPICNTTELTSADRVPNFNKCTQCRTTVCNQCGFNPNPHLTEVQEWLCLNCQMQRALGMDMTTPRSKSQQQIHCTSEQPKVETVIPPHSQPSAQIKITQPQNQPQSQPHSKMQPPVQSQALMGHKKESETLGTYQKGPQKSGLSAQTGPSQIVHEAAQLESHGHNVEFRQKGPGGAPQTSSRIPHPGAVPLPGLAKAPSQPDLGRASPIHHVGRSEHIRSAGSSPARRPASMHETPPQDGLTKLFGFGASLLNQASTLISVDPLPGGGGGGGGSAQHSPARQQGTQGTKVIFSDANSKAMTGAPDSDKHGTQTRTGTSFPQSSNAPAQKQAQQQQQPIASHQQKASQLPTNHQKTGQQQSPAHHKAVPPQQQSPAHHQKVPQQQPMAHHQKAPQQSPLKQVQKPKVTCPLCKTELNIGSSEPPNYNSCTQCQKQVCNMCGFNPTPHLVEKKEWLCLNCQTQRLMSGGLDESPLHAPFSSPKHQVGSPRHQVHQQPAPQSTSQKVSTNQQEGPSTMLQQQKTQATEGAALVAATSVKLSGDTKPPLQSSSTPTTKSVNEAQKKDKTMPKLTSEPDHNTAANEEAKSKKGTEPIVTTTTKDEKKDSQRSRYYEDTSKTNSTQDLSRSPQSLSDTGYSSDGISSSHSEITGLIHEEEMKLSEKSMSGNLTPPSPSEITKLESSMRPLLESKVFSEGEKNWDKQRGRDRHHRDSDDRKHRSQSLSISPDQYDSDEDLEDIMEEEEDPTDWDAKRELRTASTGETKKKKKAEPADITDEEFMRRQIMEMSADEENEDEEDEELEEEEEEEEEDDEGYGYQKPKKIHKHIGDSGKEKRRFTHHSSSFEEESKTTCEIYKGSAEEDLLGSQGGLRRFKTIELNNTNSYSRDMELNSENDLSLDREPELEMESLTGSPEERSRGEYSSTLPPTTSSYNSGTSPTSISSMEDDSDSSPSRRQRLEEAKQQRKARHRSHGPLLPTIEDSSEEDELREEEELLREQEKMREVEQQRIRSTARKTKRDKEELRAQRRRERSKTPPSNLSPIEDASPTEELRQAAEMEELHRSSCSEYSPSIDSEAEGFEMSSKLYKSGSEYNLPTFMLLYSPTEKSEASSCSTNTTTSSTGKPLKSAEEVYEEMMKKAEMLQKQQQQSAQLYSSSAYQEDDRRNGQHYEDDYDYIDQDDGSYENEEASDIYEEIRQTSQNITKQLDDQVEMDVSYSDKQLLDTGSAFAKLLEQSNALLTPGTSPTQLSAPVSFSETGIGGRIPDVRVTQHFSKDGHKDRIRSHASKNAIIPSTAATTITAYGVYARDGVNVSQTTTSQTMTSQQSTLYGRHTSSSVSTSTSTSSVSNKIAEITQAYNQREGRRASDRIQIRDSGTQLESATELRSHNVHVYYKGSPPLSPTSPPSHIQARSPSRRTAEFSTQTFSPPGLPPEGPGPTSPNIVQATQTPHRAISPRLFRQQSSQDDTFMLITIGSEPTSPSKPVTVNTATSPLSSPTKFSHASSFDAYSPPVSPPDTPPHQQSPLHNFYRTHKVERVNVGTSMVTAASSYARGSLSMENISLCRISTVPGTSRVEPGQKLHSASVADLRTATKASPIIIANQGMDLTSLIPESRKYASSVEGSPVRHSTTVQPLIMNLNQEQSHVIVSTATTVSVTVAASMFISQPKHPVVYADSLQNRADIGQSMGTVVCLLQNKQPPIDPSIPNIDAKLEDLSIQQQQLLKQQQKLQHQQQLLEQQLQQHHQLQQQSSLAKLSLSGQFPLLKKDLIVTHTSTAPVVSAISPALVPEAYNIGNSMELKSKSPVQPHVMMVQIDSAAQGKPLTQIIKSEDSQGAKDISGQIKKENPVACCDVVYNLPFGGSCVGGPFSPKTVGEEVANVSDPPRPPSAPPHLSETEPKQDKQIYHDFTLKSYTLPFPSRLQPSLSETNLAEAGLQSYSSKPEMQASVELSMDLNSVQQGYDGAFLGMGLQYGSFTDLRQGDVVAPTLPIRRYSSLSNINSDYGYSSCDLSSLPDSNLAQYSATTAKEISRMCAALNSIDRYGSHPDLLQLGRGGGPPGRIHLPQSIRPSFIYGPDGKPFSQALTSLINARQASLRAMYPSAIRSADGMIYSTINTPIASTVPITTQPASVMRPLIRGVHRPYVTPNMTPVPLASLNRMPVAPRMSLTGQTTYRFPTPTHVPITTSADPVSITTEQDAPIYLGKSPGSCTGSGAAPTLHSSVQSSITTTMPTQIVAPVNTQEQPLNLSQPHLHTHGPSQPIHSQLPQQSVSSQPTPRTQSTATSASTLGGLPQEKEMEEERLHRQQEKLLQFERERIELEKLRQLRIQDELERERVELQRHREKEHILVQREIQELQTIKHQVLQQQQAERENQLVMQREQLAQQKQQLDQIQSLQQQLQQHLEEQKRQKSAVVATASGTQLICDQSGRIIQPQEFPPDFKHGDIHVQSRSLPNSASEMCLRNNEVPADNRSMRKQRSMPRLQDGIEGEVTMFSLPTRIVDSSVQTDDEDEEERYLMSRRRRTRRSVDCSVQTDDDEDKAEWEQPVRRRRSRYSRHSESGADSKTETSTLPAKVASSSIAIQTIQDCSCQTETEQLGKISPAIHVTVSDPNKVEIVHYISGPERTQKGQSLACQTEPESHSQGVVVPQINVATTISPYSSSAQLVGSADPLSSRQQAVSKFERRKPDPLDIGYQQHHLHNESLSSVIRQPPKSPQVLYSPVSPSSPHRIIETSFSSSERLNKAHVTPQQKSYTAESPQRHQSLPRPMKNVQRSLSDPKPLSPTTDEQTKARISLYQQQALQSQLMALQQSSLLRKVKRTLPSPPPEETQLSMVTHALPQMYVPSLPTLPSLKMASRPGLAAKASLLKDLTHELKAVEQESTKLRKQQAELEEEEKEIDAKLRYLELGITQRKETLVKERERRELAYLRCMGDTRDYMSDSELNNLRLAAAATSEGNGLLTRPSTAPLSQFTSELNTAAQFPPTSSFVSYQYPQSQSTATTIHASTFQSTGFSQPPYPTVSQAQALPQPTPLPTLPHHPTPPYHSQGTFPSQSFPPCQPPYPTDHTMIPPTGFQPPVGQTPYPTHTTPYPSQAPPYPVSQASTYQPLADILTVHQRPRQTSLADLEHKMPTNYEVISNPSVVVTTSAQDSAYSQSGLVPSYGQYSTAMASTYGPYSTSGSNTYGGYSTTTSSYGPYTTTSANSYGQYTTTTPNTYGHTTTTVSSYGHYTTTVANTYGQTTLSEHMHSVDSPSTYTGDGLYSSSSLEQNVPRNYVMIDDISELTKEGMGTTSDPHRSEGYGRHGGDGLHTRGGSSYGRPEDERDAEMYDHHHGRAYHLGQEETDWFEKPRDVRGSRHYSGSHSSSGRRGHVKHTYHDYDEPPEEDLWPQDDYGHSRHTSSREHRHHTSGSSGGRHSSSRHSDEPRSTRSSRSSKDPSLRHDTRSVSSSSAKRGDSRSQGYHSSDYSRDPSGHHHGSRTGKQSSHHQGTSSRKQQDVQGHLSSSRQVSSTGSGQRATSAPSNSSRQPGPQQISEAQQAQRTQLQQQAQTSAIRPGQQTPAAGSVPSQPTQVQQLQAKPGQTSPATRVPPAGVQPTPATTKPEPVTAPVTAIGAKAATPQPAKAAQPPLTGIGSKAAPRPVGIGSAAAQPGMEGESVFSKILPGSAAEQAGKLGEAISGFGKKFTSLW